MDRPKKLARRDLSRLEPEAWPGWRVTTLAELGDEAFARWMLAAGEGDPYDTSTAESALDDLRALRSAAGATFDAGEWLLVEDDEGPIGVVLPQAYPSDTTRGTLFYLGVLPARRGAGLGRRLHRFGLDRLARRGVVHYRGSTDVENAPMLAIFAANGCIVEDH